MGTDEDSIVASYDSINDQKKTTFVFNKTEENSAQYSDEVDETVTSYESINVSIDGKNKATIVSNNTNENNIQYDGKVDETLASFASINDNSKTTLAANRTEDNDIQYNDGIAVTGHDYYEDSLESATHEVVVDNDQIVQQNVQVEYLSSKSDIKLSVSNIYQSLSQDFEDISSEFVDTSSLDSIRDGVILPYGCRQCEAVFMKKEELNDHTSTVHHSKRRKTIFL